MNNKSKWLIVCLYAIAMAWVESAVVYYLRTMLGRIDPHQFHPLPIIGGMGKAELVREAATMLMLLTVGILAGNNTRSRMGYFAIAFGIWDIFYYIFLKVMCGWPHSLLDWDILFLLPLPWWGPVLAPISIALLMILWGTFASSWHVSLPQDRPLTLAWMLNGGGALTCLYVFMADSIKVAGGGTEVLRYVLPSYFNWPVFCIGLACMAAPVVQTAYYLIKYSGREKEPLDTGRWIHHFARNQQNRVEPAWNEPWTFPVAALAPLRRSIEQFQLGDGGGPASLIAKNAASFCDSEPNLRAVVDLWFAEEREHSRLLGCAVKRLHGKQIKSHWSFTAFCLCRRVLGVKFELQVLLLTEITSSAYYRLLQRHVQDQPLADMCGLILRDEGGHISFHRARLAALGRSPRGIFGVLWAAQFCLCGYAAGTMLWINHRPCLIKLGASTPEFYREVTFELTRFLRGLVNVQEQVTDPEPSRLAACANSHAKG